MKHLAATQKKNGTSHRIKNGLFLTGVLGFRERFFVEALEHVEAFADPTRSLDRKASSMNRTSKAELER
jgi:hypothetical protein